MLSRPYSVAAVLTGLCSRMSPVTAMVSSRRSGIAVAVVAVDGVSDAEVGVAGSSEAAPATWNVDASTPAGRAGTGSVAAAT